MNPAPSNTPVGAIAGGIVGGVIVLVAGLLFFLWYRRRTQRGSGGVRVINPSPAPDGFAISPFASLRTAPQDSRHHNGSDSSLMGTGMGDDANSIRTRSNHPSDSSSIGANSMIPRPTHHQRSHDTVSALPTGQIVMRPNRRNTGRRDFLMDDAHLPISPVASQRSGVTSSAVSEATSDTEELRRARQEVLNGRLVAIEQELDLKNQTERRSSARRQGDGNRTDDLEMLDMRDQIRAMREEILVLQAQRTSPWAQGLSDEPPPGYSAHS